MNKKVKYMIALFLILGAMFLGSVSRAYLFGMKSRDNSIENIQQIEKEYKLDLPIVSFIFDPRGPEVEQLMSGLTAKLGQDKIYHISISPNMLTAKEVAAGKFDAQYKQFFDDVKKYDLRVIFRTMHEMNGGRYPRSSNPYRFRKAWIHAWNLSRAEGLDQNNILFDMSVNARDLPARGGKPAQTATFIQCQQSLKIKLNCPTFEDYYPGDTYVDLMGVTFYNRGKGNSNRWRGTPDQIVNAAGRKTLDRLKKFDKPIFVDEVGTTAVNYTGAYSFKKSLEVYANESGPKNARLLQLRDFLLRETKIVGAIYFNVDLTNGLKNWTIGELDRSVIDPASNKFYDKILDVYKAGLPNETNALYYLFNIKRVTIDGTTVLIKSDYVKPVKDLYVLAKASASETGNQLNFLDQTQSNGTLKSKYKRFNTGDLAAIVDATKMFFGNAK